MPTEKSFDNLKKEIANIKMARHFNYLALWPLPWVLLLLFKDVPAASDKMGDAIFWWFLGAFSHFLSVVVIHIMADDRLNKIKKTLSTNKYLLINLGFVLIHLSTICIWVMYYWRGIEAALLYWNS